MPALSSPFRHRCRWSPAPWQRLRFFYMCKYRWMSAGPASCKPGTGAPRRAWETDLPPVAAPIISQEIRVRSQIPAALRQVAHRALQSLDRGRMHASAHQFADDPDRLPVGPDLLGFRIQPDGFVVDVKHALHPHRARLIVRVLDRAAGMQDFVGAHGRIADEDELIVVPVLVHDVPGADAL